MMEFLNTDKWLNVDARCRHCKELLCCIEHRRAHEEIRHPKDLRNILSDISNKNKLNVTVSDVKIHRTKHDDTTANSLKATKITHSPNCTRKRKREAMASPKLQLKKKKGSLPSHLRTPCESPKSPLALINNGIKNDSSVFITANNTVVITSSPLTSPICSLFDSLNTQDNCSPGLETSVKRETIDFSSSGSEGNSENEKGNVDNEKQSNISSRQYLENLENSGQMKRDSGYQFQCSNTQGVNSPEGINSSGSHRLSSGSNSSEGSFRDCFSASTDFDIHAALKNPFIDVGSESLLCIRNEMKSDLIHPNINVEGGSLLKEVDLEEQEWNLNVFDVKTLTEHHEAHSLDEGTVTNESDAVQLEAVGFVDVETKDIFLPASTFQELSTILEVSEIQVANTTDHSESNFYPPAQSTFKLPNQTSDLNESPTIIPVCSEDTIVVNSTPVETDLSVYNCSTFTCSNENTGYLSTQSTNHIEDDSMIVEGEVKCSETRSRDTFNDSTTSPANDSSMTDKSVVLAGSKVNYKIKINSTYQNKQERSILSECVSSITNKIVSILRMNLTITKTTSPFHTVRDLNDYGKDILCGTEEFIRARSPIRPYIQTLELSRRLSKPIEGRPPYYVPQTLVSSLQAAEKVVFINESLFTDDESFNMSQDAE